MSEFAGAYAEGSQVFATYDDDTELQIDPQTIREAGWIRESEQDPCERGHCDERGIGSCDCGPLASDMIAPVESWHNDMHHGVFRFCDESPCRGIREVV